MPNRHNSMQKSIKNIFLLIIVIISFGIAYKLYKKAKDTEKLKIASINLKPTQAIKDINGIIDTLQNGLHLKGFVQIRNFSGQDYTLNQLSIDGFSPVKNKLIAEQTNINKNDIILKNKQETNIPLEYKVDVMSALSLFKESGVIPQDATLWGVLMNVAEYFSQENLSKLKLQLKGFIEAEGITLNINQEQFLYN